MGSTTRRSCVTRSPRCRMSGSARSSSAAPRSCARGPTTECRSATRALAAGLPYVGADFRFDPPVFEPFELPSIAVIGTGKRVGKTAVTAHLARLLARDRSVVVVAMGRGGPPEPEVVATPPTIDDLVARSRAGRHAASDHLELAA